MGRISRWSLVVVCVLAVVVSAVPAAAQQPRGYMQRNLAVNRHNPADRHSPPRASIIDPDLRNP